MKQIQIKSEFIKLSAFIKLSGIASTGGQAKQIIQAGKVKVNGVPCSQRGKKLYDNDVVSYNLSIYEVKKTGDNKNNV